MTLVRSEGILATVTKVAESNPDAAIELVRLGLFESLADQIDAYRPMLEADALAFIDSKIAKARTVLLRTHVGKALANEAEPEDLEVAQGLAILEAYVEKGIGDFLSGAALALFNRQHPRDAGGRFTSTAVGGQVDPNMESKTRRSAHREDAVQQARSWKEQKLANDDTPVQLVYRRIDPMTGRDAGESLAYLPATVGNLQDKLEEYDRSEGGQRLLVGMQLARGDGAPGGGPKQRAAMDAMSMLTSNQAALGVGQRFVNQAPGRGDWDDAGEKWNRSGSPGDRQGYRRLKMTGEALNSVSQNGSVGSMIGGLAQLIGDMGPEAEKVLGPGFQRAAYRYRGTERRPDKDMVNSVDNVNRMAAALSVRNDQQRARNYSLVMGEANRLKGDVSAQVAAYYAGESVNRDQFELRASGDVAAAMLAQDLPDTKVAQLSIASGEIPPSEGVIINADGHVVSQAIGFKGDHYLPFDLKNLKELRGGQYVRTRLSGGPSTEDIYTGLLTGARQLQVVSHSGVFTVQFDPDLRGGRRYTDKARKMVGRYESLLTVLAGGDQVRQDIAPAEQARLKRQAYGDANWNAEIGEQNFQADLKRRRMEASVGMDEEDMEAQALASAKESPDWARASRSQREEIIQSEQRNLRDSVGAAAYRMYRLDGPGYDAALKALKQEFPYFIKDVKWEPLPEFNTDRGLPRGDSPRFAAPDRGYVGPDKLHPFDRGGRSRQTEQTETKTEEAGGASRPAQGSPRGAAPAAAEKPAQTLADLTKGQAFTQVMAGTLLDTIGAITRNELPVEIPSEWEESNAIGRSPEAYMKWAYLKHGSGNPDKFAAWLTGQATPEQRAKVAEGAERWADLVPEYGPAAGDPDKAVEGAQALSALVDAMDPFDTTPDNNKIDAMPATQDPRPIAYADIVTLTTEKALEDYASQATHRDQLLAAQIETAMKDPHQMPARIRGLIKTYQQDTNDKAAEANLIAAQKAWSYAVMSETVKTLGEFGLLDGGGAAPFAQRPSEGEPPKQIGKSLRRGSLRPLLPAQSRATTALVEKFLASL